MLSFLRPRVSPPPPPPPLRKWTWSDQTLSLELDPSLAGSTIAVDLDGQFFTTANVGTDGLACVRFAFPPWGAATASAMPRRSRGGEPLSAEPLALAFPPMWPDRLVPFGVDCSADEVAIVVPVYDAPVLVERCLESVLAHTTGRARLIVIDDASRDPAIAPLLARHASRGGVTVLRNAGNRGFTATANRGIAEAGSADVVLLNADTEVGPNWLTGLRRALHSTKNVATVTAVSDNAGAFSVPELEAENAMPRGWSFTDTARALWHAAGTVYPELPTGNGFCMYIRRAVIGEVGALDEAAFPHGYGEENDFCQRASARGYRHLVAGNVYVRHARSASFGHERRARLGEAGMAVLRERWPSYERDVASSLFSFERRVLDWRVRRIFDASADYDTLRLRILNLSSDLPVSETGQVETPSEPPAGASLWNMIQASGFDAVVADERVASAREIAAALGIPFAHLREGERIDACVQRALASSRSFAP
jgi:GT2 family glycosyltransferase